MKIVGVIVACVAAVAAVTLAAPLAAGAEQRARVAILSIEVVGDAQVESKNQLFRSLAGGLYTAGFEVIEDKEVKAQLRAAPELTGCVTTTCLERLGSMLRAQRFVRARVTAEGMAWTIELELFSPTVAGPVGRVEKSCAPCTFDEANDLMSAGAKELKDGAGDEGGAGGGGAPGPTPGPGTGPKADLWPVKVTSEPPGAEIAVDGKVIGVAPLEVMLATGEHVFDARMPGRAPAKVTASVTTQAGAESATQVVAMTLPPALVDGGGERSSRRRMYAWGAAGAGAAMLLGGVWLLSLDGDGIGCPPGPGLCPEHYETSLGGSLLAVGGVALGGVATWLFLKDDGERPRAGTDVGVSARGVVVRGRF